MIARVLAWVVVIALAVAVYRLGNQWRNPWGAGLVPTVSPVLANLPTTPPGCGEKCHD